MPTPAIAIPPDLADNEITGSIVVLLLSLTDKYASACNQAMKTRIFYSLKRPFTICFPKKKPRKPPIMAPVISHIILPPDAKNAMPVPNNKKKITATVITLYFLAFIFDCGTGGCSG